MLNTTVSPVAAGVRQALTQLRDYQYRIKCDLQDAWAHGHQNVLVQLPTGGGKTVILSHVVLEHDGSSVVMAHRRELIGQISLALARNGVKHRIIAPNNVIKSIVRSHVEEIGASYYDPSARTGVASVDTVVARRKDNKWKCAADQIWADKITLWVQDEAHHVLKNNKWGKACEAFKNAKGLGVTATPGRADGKGLGRHASGLFDVLIEGVSMRWLIDQGYLTDFRVFCPPNDLDMSEARIGADGDYTIKSSAAAFKRSSITGDLVRIYKERLNGKRVVTFAPDVENASTIAMNLNRAGVPAEALSAKSKDTIRDNCVKKLARGELLQLVNVSLFDEGFDLPAIDAVQDAQATLSFNKYAQKFGRMLRPMYAKGYDLSTKEGRLAAIANGSKPVAYYFDHVGNVIKHNGTPDMPRQWSLDDREKRSSSGVSSVPLRVCLNPVCMSPYERFEPVCPWCGEAAPPPERRDSPEFVDGDLLELDKATLQRLFGQAVDTSRNDTDLYWEAVNKKIPAEGQNRYIEKQKRDRDAQVELGMAIDWWAGWQRDNGLTDAGKRYKLFYYTFGVDVATARTFESSKAQALAQKIYTEMGVLTA